MRLNQRLLSSIGSRVLTSEGSSALPPQLTVAERIAVVEARLLKSFVGGAALPHVELLRTMTQSDKALYHLATMFRYGAAASEPLTEQLGYAIEEVLLRPHHSGSTTAMRLEQLMKKVTPRVRVPLGAQHRQSEVSAGTPTQTWKRSDASLPVVHPATLGVSAQVPPSPAMEPAMEPTMEPEVTQEQAVAETAAVGTEPSGDRAPSQDGQAQAASHPKKRKRQKRKEKIIVQA
jgi:hypothetical protein